MEKKKKYFVKSLEQFIKVVDQIIDRWSNEDGEYIYPWFRGHANHTYSLKPGIYRDPKLLANEDSYMQDFMFKAYPFLDQSYYKPTNYFEWYFLMQHYGLPTRLLDWTEGSLIALHFALNYKTDESDPCVWVLNPFKFNKHFRKKGIIFTSEEELQEYMPEIWSKDKLPENPIAIQPHINSKRIFSQKGCFMIFGSDQIDLAHHKLSDDFLIKIKIDNYQIEPIRDSLTVTGVTESIVYPELSGLAKEIKHYYRL
jgi:FRG domain-containing protein